MLLRCMTSVSKLIFLYLSGAPPFLLDVGLLVPASPGWNEMVQGALERAWHTEGAQ